MKKQLMLIRMRHGSHAAANLRRTQQYARFRRQSLICNNTYWGDENAVNVHINRLRNKIEDNFRAIDRRSSNICKLLHKNKKYMGGS